MKSIQGSSPSPHTISSRGERPALLALFLNILVSNCREGSAHTGVRRLASFTEADQKLVEGTRPTESTLGPSRFGAADFIRLSTVDLRPSLRESHKRAAGESALSFGRSYPRHRQNYHFDHVG